MIENLIPNFPAIYREYSNLFDQVEIRIADEENEAEINNLLSFQNEFNKFDTKLRLGISITEITLDDNFVRRKMGALKDCHLYFYKLTDLWFAYETYFKFYFSALNINLSNRKIIWLDDNTNEMYYNNDNIQTALWDTNNEVIDKFPNVHKRKALKEYLIYCMEGAKGGQKSRLNTIINKISINNELPLLNHSELLTITYSIRNNFVHNGEVTIYPENFSYVLKNRLLQILYKYLVVITVKSASITIEEKLRISIV
ncbi:hypothetical protein [Kaistella jeonii]|uniref:Apea-like HEPN domain-containing protein n=1 Tax=Kaistella jeonii TaxID=266749 RepID=A0A0C1D9E9_9FLAO|nr:hypothetical protein [Kaistella jeonii]KIA90515.1 hypothetical protein OA86_01120 [Kaistella jeonii]SFB71554.1 hypothetical protein SAMN05421876_101307 [Kaistella jeonii]VEI94898.1 Uncharacterised protein [Kaistella jeonii]